MKYASTMYVKYGFISNCIRIKWLHITKLILTELITLEDLLRKSGLWKCCTSIPQQFAKIEVFKVNYFRLPTHYSSNAFH